MNLALGCSPLYPGLYFANLCLRRFNINFKVIYLSKSKLKRNGKTYGPLASLNFMLKRLGIRFTSYLMFEYMAPQLLKKLTGKFSPDRLWSFNELAEKYNFKIIELEDFNSGAFLQGLQGIDILLLNGTDQILKHNTIETPKVSCLNFHPSFLPEYRGVDPIFQMMLNNEDFVAMTLHQITTDLDKGPIVGRRKISVSKDLSYLGRKKKANDLGCEILVEYLQNINNFVPENLDEKVKNYYKTIPQKPDVDLFRAQGHKFLSWAQIKGFSQF